MQSLAQIVANKQLVRTILISASAFLIALPIGGAIMSNGNTAQAAGTSSAVTDSCAVPGTGSATTSSTPTGLVNNSANNGGATAQVGGNGVAVAANDVSDVTVGDVTILSNNHVLSDNSAPVDASALSTLGVLGL